MKFPKLGIKLLSFRKKANKSIIPPIEDESVAQRESSLFIPQVESEDVSRRSILAALEIQSSPVFQLPDEIFLEIFTYFPVLKWSDLYYRFNHAWYTPIPDVYGERIHALVALSATCRAMRYRFLPDVWERVLMCLKRWRRGDEIPSRLSQLCRTLSGNLRLAAHVKTMTVDLACEGTETILGNFTKCLVVLKNLHTLEVISVGNHYAEPLCEALRGIQLPQIKTLILPSTAHCLLRHCPNIDDLTCTPFRPNEDFVKSLIVRGKNLRRFAVSFPGNTIPWTDVARAFPDINELSVVFDNNPGDTLDCITSMKKLSILQIIYFVPHHDIFFCGVGLTPESFQEQVRFRAAYRERMKKEYENRWSEMKKNAIEHLGRCSGPGPKTLRTILLDRDEMFGTYFDSVTNTEETLV